MADRLVHAARFSVVFGVSLMLALWWCLSGTPVKEPRRPPVEIYY